jgi:hypothetical protein
MDKRVGQMNQTGVLCVLYLFVQVLLYYQLKQQHQQQYHPSGVCCSNQSITPELWCSSAQQQFAFLSICRNSIQLSSRSSQSKRKKKLIWKTNSQTEKRKMIKILMQDDVSLGRTFFLPSIVFIWACYLLNNHFFSFLFLSLHSVVLFVLFIYYFHVFLFFVIVFYFYFFFQWIDDLL